MFKTRDTHAHTYAQVWTHTHAHAHIHTRMYTQTHTHTHTRTHTRVHTYTHACTHKHTHTHACTHKHTHTQTHTHTHTHQMYLNTHTHIQSSIESIASVEDMPTQRGKCGVGIVFGKIRVPPTRGGRLAGKKALCVKRVKPGRLISRACNCVLAFICVCECTCTCVYIYSAYVRIFYVYTETHTINKLEGVCMIVRVQKAKLYTCELLRMCYGLQIQCVYKLYVHI
jgi:hypothetical protein